jgi:hypothetical protein
LRNDAPLAEALAVFLGTIASVTLNDLGLAQRRPGLATIGGIASTSASGA